MSSAAYLCALHPEIVHHGPSSTPISLLRPIALPRILCTSPSLAFQHHRSHYILLVTAPSRSQLTSAERYRAPQLLFYTMCQWMGRKRGFVTINAVRDVEPERLE